MLPISFYPLCYSAAAVEAERTIREGPRHDWSKYEINSIYDSPFHGAQVHRHAHNFREVEQCTLVSVKTGRCSEDCSYCPQSSRYDTGVKAQKLMTKETVMQATQKAKEAGSTRFSMGAAWRDTIGRKTNFNDILEYVKEIREMGVEVCCTLGMLEKQHALELKKAGLTAYNHSHDTSKGLTAYIQMLSLQEAMMNAWKHLNMSVKQGLMSVLVIWY